jgi:hypothetical protein
MGIIMEKELNTIIMEFIQVKILIRNLIILYNSGQIKHGALDGYGTYIFENGDKYEGLIKFF